MPQSQSKKNLVVDAIYCTRGERSLINSLSFNLHSGSCLHIMGPNGSGKSTLLRTIVGLHRPDSGNIKWLDHCIWNNPRYQAAVAYIGHLDGLKSELSAAENLTIAAALQGVTQPSLVDSTLMTLGILDCADLSTNVLSFGQRRRLAFAKLLINTQELWVLDEPFTGIDTKGRDLIESLCLSHLERGGSIILTNHQALNQCKFAERLEELHLGEEH